jgi:hypothetical protein
VQVSGEDVPVQVAGIALPPLTVKLGALGVKLGATPPYAIVAIRLTEVALTTESTTPVCGATLTVNWPAVAVPLRGIVWGEFAALSVNTKEPAIDPAAVGAKLTTSVQLAPGAREPGFEDVVVSCGQVELPTLTLKLAALRAIFGLVPVPGTVKSNAGLPLSVLPLFATTKVCELLAPTAVETKVRDGGPWAFNSSTAGMPVSATYRLPLASTATPVGVLNPLPSVKMVGFAGVGGTAPLTATISLTTLLLVSPT